jgi:hypothetical protein
MDRSRSEHGKYHPYDLCGDHSHDRFKYIRENSRVYPDTRECVPHLPRDQDTPPCSTSGKNSLSSMSEKYEPIRCMERMILDESPQPEGFDIFPQYFFDGDRRWWAVLGRMSSLDMTPAEFISHGGIRRIYLFSANI